MFLETTSFTMPLAILPLFNDDILLDVDIPVFVVSLRGGFRIPQIHSGRRTANLSIETSLLSAADNICYVVFIK